MSHRSVKLILQVQTLEYLCLSKYFCMASLEEISHFKSLGKMRDILHHTNSILLFHCEINIYSLVPRLSPRPDEK